MTAGVMHPFTREHTRAFHAARAVLIEDLKHGRVPVRRDGKIPLLVAAHRVLEEHYGPNTKRAKQSLTALAELWYLFPDACLEDLTRDKLHHWNKVMIAKGNTPGTRISRLNVVGGMYKHFDTEDEYRCRIPYPRNPPKLKWWLNPETEAKVVEWCDSHGDAPRIALRDYVRFVVRTGLRVQEAMRLQRMHLTGIGTDKPTVLVPGTKTMGAQQPLPLIAEAVDIIIGRIGSQGEPDDYLFAAHHAYRRVPRRGDNMCPRALRYNVMQGWWKECRAAVGIPVDLHTGMKAFRRSFARIASDRGVPTEIIQMYLRHERITTTQGYLRLVGQGDVERLRKWFH